MAGNRFLFDIILLWKELFVLMSLVNPVLNRLCGNENVINARGQTLHSGINQIHTTSFFAKLRFLIYKLGESAISKVEYILFK